MFRNFSPCIVKLSSRMGHYCLVTLVWGHTCTCTFILLRILLTFGFSMHLIPDPPDLHACMHACNNNNKHQHLIPVCYFRSRLTPHPLSQYCYSGSQFLFFFACPAAAGGSDHNQPSIYAKRCVSHASTCTCTCMYKIWYKSWLLQVHSSSRAY